MKLITLVIALVVFSSSGFAAPAGEGARPLSPRVVSMWQLESTSAGKPTASLFVMIRASQPNWYQTKTSHRSVPVGSDVLRWEWTIGAYPKIDAEWNMATHRYTAFGTTIDLDKYNVILIDNYDSAPTVRGLGKANLTAGENEDLPKRVLAQLSPFRLD